MQAPPIKPGGDPSYRRHAGPRESARAPEPAQDPLDPAQDRVVAVLAAVPQEQDGHDRAGDPDRASSAMAIFAIFADASGVDPSQGQRPRCWRRRLGEYPLGTDDFGLSVLTLVIAGIEDLTAGRAHRDRAVDDDRSDDRHRRGLPRGRDRHGADAAHRLRARDPVARAGDRAGLDHRSVVAARSSS